MALTTIPAAGAKLRGSVLSALITEVRPLSAVKSADTSRTSDATRTADPDLTITLPANSTWDFDLKLMINSAADAAGDFTGELAYPSGASVSNFVHGLIDTIATGRTADLYADGNPFDATSPSAQFDVGCSATVIGVYVAGRIVMGATAGNLVLNWGQLASNVNATTLQDGSTMTCHRLA